MRFLFALSTVALAAGLARPPEPQPAPPVRSALDEALEEWRAQCDSLAGEALQHCLNADGDPAR